MNGQGYVPVFLDYVLEPLEHGLRPVVVHWRRFSWLCGLRRRRRRLRLMAPARGVTPAERFQTFVRPAVGATFAARLPSFRPGRYGRRQTRRVDQRPAVQSQRVQSGGGQRDVRIAFGKHVVEELAPDDGRRSRSARTVRREFHLVGRTLFENRTGSDSRSADRGLAPPYRDRYQPRGENALGTSLITMVIFGIVRRGIAVGFRNGIPRLALPTTGVCNVFGCAHMENVRDFKKKFYGFPSVNSDRSILVGGKTQYFRQLPCIFEKLLKLYEFYTFRYIRMV